MDLYIKKATPLPLTEYYQKIGVKYSADKYLFEIDENATKKQIELRNHWLKAL